MATELPDFLIIPTVLLHDPEIQNLDRFVYAVIYWYTKLALKKCILSNVAIAKLLNVSAGSVANSISRLNRRGYIEAVMGDRNNRKELIPRIQFGVQLQTKGGVHPQTKGSSSADEHNKIHVTRTTNTKVLVRENLLPVASMAKSVEGQKGDFSYNFHETDNVTLSPLEYNRAVIRAVAHAQGMQTFQNYGKQLRYAKMLRENKVTIEEIVHAATEMKKEDFWLGQVFDVSNVWNNIHKYTIKKVEPTESEKRILELRNKLRARGLA